MSARLTKEEVRRRLCSLSALVAGEYFDWNHPADCFCDQGMAVAFDDYRYSDEVLAFIEAAVHAAIAKAEGKP